MSRMTSGRECRASKSTRRKADAIGARLRQRTTAFRPASANWSAITAAREASRDVSRDKEKGAPVGA